MSIRVLIVDDSRTARELYESYLRISDRYTLAGSLENAKAALLFCRTNPVDLILMDVYTRDRESGLEAAAEVKRQYPGIRILITTSLPEASFIEKAKAAGCESFWYKEMGEISFFEVLNRTADGESVYPKVKPKVQIGLAGSVEFTPAEMLVLRKLCEGKLNRDIAEELNISENTVKYHIANMLSKSGYSSKYQLAIDAVERKLIVPGF